MQPELCRCWKRGCDNVLKGAQVGVLGTPAMNVPIATHHYMPSQKHRPGSELRGKCF